MRNKTTISFSCPEKTTKIIDEYSNRLGISRSACITMMCNAYIIADSRHGFSRTANELLKEEDSNGN